LQPVDHKEQRDSEAGEQRCHGEDRRVDVIADAGPHLPRDRPLLVYCAGGYRSSIAASLLQSRGFGQVSEIAGGITAWEAANLPVEADAVS